MISWYVCTGIFASVVSNCYRLSVLLLSAFAKHPVFSLDYSRIGYLTYRTRSTGTPVYLTDLIKNYHLYHTLQSADKLLLSVPRMTLSLLAKACSVSAPSVWNSLSYNCRSAESFSSFRRALKTELFDTAYSERKHSFPTCTSDLLATYKCILIDRLIKTC